MYVTWSTPFERATVPRSADVTPEPAAGAVEPAGTVKGGHAVAHAPVHVVAPVPSGAYRLTVAPVLDTSTTPWVAALDASTTPETGAVFDEEFEVAAVDAVVDAVDDELLESQAASGTRAAVPTALASRR